MDRRLTTILIADLVGYSRLMATDEEGVIERLRDVRKRVIDPAIVAAHGNVIKTMGDGLLLEFSSPVAAVRAALRVQREMAAREAAEPEDRRLRFRIGINLGDVVIEGNDILGDAVNVAARLEGIAPAGGVCVSRTVAEQVRGHIDAEMTALGSHTVKNLPEPVEVWQVEVEGASVGISPASRRDAPTIIVLPFSEQGAGSDDMFADGIVDEITSALGRVHEFLVIARQSAFVYRGQAVDIRKVAQDVGANYVVEGSVRRSGERVRINIGLVNGKTGLRLWEERYDDRIDDLFDLQDRIAAQVAGAISPSVRATEISLARAVPPADRGAYDLVLSAYPHFWVHRKTDNAKAIELLTLALDRDSEEVRARSLRAWCHAQEAAYLWTDEPAKARAQAENDATIAVNSAGDHAPSLVACAAAFGMATNDAGHARSLLNRALSIDPNNAWGWMRSGWLRAITGEHAAALDDFERAERLSPRDPFHFNLLFGRSNAYCGLGDFDRAVDCVREGLRAGPGVTWAYRMLASYEALAERPEAAAAALAEYVRHHPGVTIKKLRDALPPLQVAADGAYFEGMRQAGVPEE